LAVLALAQQQPERPHRFGGTATLHGKAVAAGVAVAAWVDGKSVATNTAGGTYIIDVAHPEGASYAGKTVAFTVAGFPATQTATWTLGGATVLNLSAVSEAFTVASTGDGDGDRGGGRGGVRSSRRR